MIPIVRDKRIATKILGLFHDLEPTMFEWASKYVVILTNPKYDVYPQEQRQNIALQCLKASVLMPHEHWDRIQYAITKHTKDVVDAMLATIESPTLDELKPDLETLKTYSDMLKEKYQSGEWTTNQIADHILANCSPIDQDENVLTSPGFVQQSF